MISVALVCNAHKARKGHKCLIFFSTTHLFDYYFRYWSDSKEDGLPNKHSVGTNMTPSRHCRCLQQWKKKPLYFNTLYATSAKSPSQGQWKIVKK
jgi:hypothetical protein